MTKVYRTFAKVSSPCLFDYQTQKEALEVNGSPLAKPFDAFTFEKYRPDIVDCVTRETAKKKLASEGLPKKTLNLFNEQDLAYAYVSPRDSVRLHRKDARGRRALDSVVIFGIRYRLSDEELAFKLRDFYSFRVFLGLFENDRISRQSIWQYREYFTNGGLCQNLARKYVEELTDASLVGNSARILDGSFVEAQVAFTASHIFGEDFGAGQGVTIEQDSINSYVARAGLAVGIKCPDNMDSVWMKASYLYDFDGETTTTAKNGTVTNQFTQDLGGGWYELGLGASLNITKNLHGYADFEYASGAEIETPYKWNVGVRYTY